MHYYSKTLDTSLELSTCLFQPRKLIDLILIVNIIIRGKLQYHFSFVLIIFNRNSSLHTQNKAKEMKDKGKPRVFCCRVFPLHKLFLSFEIIFLFFRCFVLYEKRVESSCAFVIFYILSILPEPRVSLFQKH